MTFQQVANLDDLKPGGALKVTVDGLPIALVRDSAGEVHALGDKCSHGDISLSEGFVEDDTIECWAHGSKFGLADGSPRNFPAFEPVPVYQVKVTENEIFVDPNTGK
jgi:3-phenylpropionate/trans-cinnamate dioxygenase ferredoxin subunit